MVSLLPPCIIHEDEHLLVANKPAGWNTHAPAPYAGEGLYDWLRHREPRWANLAIIHRLDKETSGIIVFAKSALACKELTSQFERHAIQKKYVFLTDKRPPKPEITAVCCIVRAAERYVCRPVHAGAPVAETRFRLLGPASSPGLWRVEAVPMTGRTHQIRAQAAENGFPVLGDVLYGGKPAPRVCLHAMELSIKHPATGAPEKFCVPSDFEARPGRMLRAAFIVPDETNAFRLINGASDGWPGVYVEKLGNYALVESDRELPDGMAGQLLSETGCAGLYFKRLQRQLRQLNPGEAAPKLVAGTPAPSRFEIRENGVAFALSFQEGYSVGLFLDQRDNRRRFLTRHVAAGFPLYQTDSPEVLNTFSYTCGFSVCAALSGARVTSVDLSQKYLAWGMENFRLNKLEPDAHEFLRGDVFDWLKRLRKKGRRFDVVVLDPPTFSQSKTHGRFRAETDFGGLVEQALPLLKPCGVLLASTNAAALPAPDFVKTIQQAAAAGGRRIIQSHYVPQPPDFPISRAEPAYLKTIWARIE